MPYHHLQGAHLHEDTMSIERDGEQVTESCPCLEHPGYYHVWTKFIGQPTETRVVKLDEMYARLEHLRHPGYPPVGGDAA